MNSWFAEVIGGMMRRRDQDIAPGPPPVMTPNERQLVYWERLQVMGDMDMTTFHKAGSKPSDADDWLFLLYRNFKMSRCPKEYRRDLAVNYRKGNAQTWWEGVSQGWEVR